MPMLRGEEEQMEEQMDITHKFTDIRFRSYIQERYCGGRERILRSDVEAVAELDVSSQQLDSLAGIEHFTALETLDCRANRLTELDTGRLPELRRLDCSYNRLRELKLQHNPRLIELDCNENELTQLELNANHELRSLACGFNRLRRLDLTGNRELRELDCCWNLLSELDLSSNLSLQQLNCGYNSLFALELTRQTELLELDCGHCYLGELDLTSCGRLEALRCNHNHLPRLDLSGNPALQRLRCFNNHLSELDVSGSPELVEVYASQNKLTAIDTSALRGLDRLDIADNLITQPSLELDGVGMFVYDASFLNYTATLDWQGAPLDMTVHVSDIAALERLAPALTASWARLSELHGAALERIAEAHPDEDVDELTFGELICEADGTLRLGFDAGESPAGHLVIYAAFDPSGQPVGELVYETY